MRRIVPARSTEPVDRRTLARDLSSTAPRARRHASPQQGDTLETLAARELPELEPGEAQERLRAWNPHLGFSIGRQAQALLVSQIVYLEPPLDGD